MISPVYADDGLYVRNAPLALGAANSMILKGFLAYLNGEDENISIVLPVTRTGCP